MLVSWFFAIFLFEYRIKSSWPIIVKFLQKIGTNQSWIKLDGKFIRDLNGHWSLMSGILFWNPLQSFSQSRNIRGTSNIGGRGIIINWFYEAVGTLFVWKVPQNPLTTGWRKSGVSGWWGECGAKQHLMTLVYNSGNVKTTKSGSPSSHHVSLPPNGFPPGIWGHNEQGLILFLVSAWLPALVLTLWCVENWADFRKTGPWHRIKSQHRPRHL